MPETASDTGPILHLHEIGRLSLLTPLSPLKIPDLVQAELGLYKIHAAELTKAGIELSVIPGGRADLERDPSRSRLLSDSTC